MESIDTEQTFKKLILMYKGAQVCKNEALAHRSQIATPAGRVADMSTKAELTAKNFLVCYDGMVKESMAHCNK